MLGSLFGSSTKDVTTTTKSSPWKPQQEYLKTGFKEAGGALSGALDFNKNLTDPIANLTQDQLGAMSGIQGVGTAGMNVGNNMMTAAGYGLGGMDAYSQNASSLFAKAGQDPTQNIITSAGQFAKNPYMQGQIDAAIGDVQKGFDITKGAINANASANGNMGSTRTGITEALALDDAQDRAAMISANMRGDAYNTGLNIANQNYQNQIDNQFRANQGIGQGVELGMGLGVAGVNAGLQAGSGALDAASIRQQQAQAEIDGARDLAYADLGLVGQYMSTVGGNYGGTTTSTTPVEKPGIGQTLLGAGLSLAGSGAFGAGGWLMPGSIFGGK